MIQVTSLQAVEHSRQMIWKGLLGTVQAVAHRDTQLMNVAKCADNSQISSSISQGCRKERGHYSSIATCTFQRDPAVL